MDVDQRVSTGMLTLCFLLDGFSPLPILFRLAQLGYQSLPSYKTSVYPGAVARRDHEAQPRGRQLTGCLLGCLTNGCIKYVSLMRCIGCGSSVWGAEVKTYVLMTVNHLRLIYGQNSDPWECLGRGEGVDGGSGYYVSGGWERENGRLVVGMGGRVGLDSVVDVVRDVSRQIYLARRSTDAVQSA